MADDTLTLMELIEKLFTDVGLRAAIAADPETALAPYHLGDISPEDVHDALVLVQDNDTTDFSRHVDSGADVKFAAPPAVPAHHEGSDHQAAVDYLRSYITNNYVDDRDTNVDNSVNQHIDTGGGDFDQDIDTHSVVASGDGAVAAGDDIRDSKITSGDGNQVGDGNVRGDGNVVGDGNHVVSGDGNTVAFGSGDANTTSFDHTTVDHGGAIAVGGEAEGYNNQTDSHDTTTTTTDTDIRDDHSLSFDSHDTTNSDNRSESSSDTDSHNDTTTHVNSDNSFDDHSHA